MININDILLILIDFLVLFFDYQVDNWGAGRVQVKQTLHCIKKRLNQLRHKYLDRVQVAFFRVQVGVQVDFSKVCVNWHLRHARRGIAKGCR